MRPLPRAPVSDVLATSRLLFGTEAMEYRTPTATRLGAFIGIKEYPTPSSPGMLNRLLTAPFPFVLTQSFAFLPKSTAQGLLSRQYHRMTNSGDLAVSQAEALKSALDQLSGNEFVMGDHHLSLQVMTELRPAEQDASSALRGLNESVALARAWLGECGMVVAREDLALEAAFWAQLPGNFGFRPRKAPITSRNFAGLAPLHNFPVGRASGNHWGEALALFATSAHSPYYFSLHASDPREADGGSRRDTGHTFICGPTGSGKTVFLGFCVAMLAKLGATQVIFDKDRGLEILVRAMGGRYRSLRFGAPTGFNPLALPEGAAASGVPEGVADGAGLAGRSRPERAGGGGPGAGAGGHARAAAGVAAVVETGRVPRLDRCGRAARTTGALVRARRAASTPGRSMVRRTRTARGSGPRG